ncbi:hypothetical protein KIL84_014118 [Mauremys mutica]|uniref:Uncharacterized protein n=1 Tax=Mauremys mutica TaxID=74926 RepID=A0A9D3XP31_9SAUR|nr:hypothetical protein KIL84_014118 [Mauremys mutica]
MGISEDRCTRRHNPAQYLAVSRSASRPPPSPPSPSHRDPETERTHTEMGTRSHEDLFVRFSPLITSLALFMAYCILNGKAKLKGTAVQARGKAKHYNQMFIFIHI